MKNLKIVAIAKKIKSNKGVSYRCVFCIFAFLMCVCAFVGSQTPKQALAQVDETYYARIESPSTQLYSAPTELTALCTLPQTYYVKLDGTKTGNFYAVTYNGAHGYVKANSVTIVDGTPQAPYYTPALSNWTSTTLQPNASEASVSAAATETATLKTLLTKNQSATVATATTITSTALIAANADISFNNASASATAFASTAANAEITFNNASTSAAAFASTAAPTEISFNNAFISAVATTEIAAGTQLSYIGHQLGATVHDNVNLWYYVCLPTGQIGYVFSGTCNQLPAEVPPCPDRNLPALNTDIFAQTATQEFSTLSTGTKVLLIIAIAVPSVLILYFLVKPSKLAKLANGKTKKASTKKSHKIQRHGDYFEFDESEL